MAFRRRRSSFKRRGRGRMRSYKMGRARRSGGLRQRLGFRM